MSSLPEQLPVPPADWDVVTVIVDTRDKEEVIVYEVQPDDVARTIEALSKKNPDSLVMSYWGLKILTDGERGRAKR